MAVRQPERPVISFRRNGEKLTLGTDSEASVLHLHGSTGLGLAPASFALTDKVGADGATLRGVRYTAREIFLPIMLYNSEYSTTNDARDRLYRLLAPHLGDVEIKLEDPTTGTAKYIAGRLKDGLEGEFGSDFFGNYQTLGLTFVCPDPWWEGEQRSLEFAVNPSVKPFLSRTSNFFPVVLSKSSIQGSFSFTLNGDAEVHPIIRITGPGNGPVLTVNGVTFQVTHSLRTGDQLIIDSARGTLTPNVWEKVPLTARMPVLRPGSNQVSLTMVGSTPDTKVEFLYREKFLGGI